MKTYNFVMLITFLIFDKIMDVWKKIASYVLLFLQR